MTILGPIRIKQVYFAPEMRALPEAYITSKYQVERTCAPLPGAKILFLDGDGGLRRHPDGETLDGLPAIEQALRGERLRDVLIVACGYWKRLFPTAMRNLFSTDIAERIIDCTPDLEPDGELLQSHLEIFGWLFAHPEIADYCVIEPNWPVEPYLESAIYIADDQVFGEDPEHIQFLEFRFDPRPGDELAAMTLRPLPD